MLRVESLEVVYQRILLTLKGVSMTVEEGGISALLGGNGAGKTTTLKAVSGLLESDRGEVIGGSIEWDGESIVGLSAPKIVKTGIVQVMEGRRIFEHLTVEENIAVGAYVHGGIRRAQDLLTRVYEYLPALAGLRRVQAGYLSGGEQQMLAIGRALMTRPRLLLLDEPSLGLAPRAVEEIFTILELLSRDSGLSILLVEQNVEATLAIAHRGYVMEVGRIVFEGTAEELRNNRDVAEFYLGLANTGQQKGYREVKHYRRRKRW